MMMSAAEAEMPPAAAAELKEWGGRVLLIVFRSIPAPIVLSIAVWRSYSGPLSDFSCLFETDRQLLGLWPTNLRYMSQLHDFDFTHGDRCWFFAVTSTVSVLYLCWFFLVICRCVFVLRQIKHVAGTTKYILPKIYRALFAVVGVGLAVAAGLQFAIAFEPSRGPHGLSTLLPIGWAASKVVFFIMPMSFMIVGFASNMLVLLLKYLRFRFVEE
jgi:hypothetical protein